MLYYMRRHDKLKITK